MHPISFLRLGYYFFKLLLLRSLGRVQGISVFGANYYTTDRLLPLTAEERSRMPPFSRCINCGACDAHPVVPPGTTFGPSLLALSFSRNLPDFEAIEGYLAGLEGTDWAALEAVCPTRVPFLDLVRFVEERIRRRRAITSC